ncbi:MAG: hypothetical protein JW841_00030 [Deltaproteobacteria bacterium]|nr:hypothetical protein [Deltaproteobacteria bacterium]
MRELEIDWAALHSAFQMSMPEVRCFLSLEDGRVLKTPPGDPLLAKFRSEPEKYVPIEAIPSRIQYQWLDSFIKSVEDESIRPRMEAAVNGKGAFRRFKDILLTLPDERRRWFEFRDQLLRQRIVEWIREIGVETTNEPPWLNQPPGTLEAPVPANSDKDIEDLRDFIIAWVDGQHPEDVVAPLSLEKLAHDISTRFKVKRLQSV